MSEGFQVMFPPVSFVWWGMPWKLTASNKIYTCIFPEDLLAFQVVAP